MNLLGAKLYDPSSAASKATSSLLAMTAFDTTNLRLTVTVPSHGFLFVRMRCAIEGATTFPQVLLGVLDGSTVRGRVQPLGALGGTALATTRDVLVAEFTIPGLTPGSMTLDAAYGVEIVVAATNIKYGGPNNTTTDDAWGGFLFEIWDPQPFQTNGQIVVDSSGRLDVSKISGTSQTARDLGASVLLSPGTGTGQVDLSSGQVKLQADQAVNTTKFGGTTVTGRDLGASVLLSSGTGTGQLDFTSGVVKANLAQILGTALTETAGQIAAAFKKLFDVASPVLTATSVNQTGDNYARLGAPAGASVSADIAAVKSDSAAIKAKTDNLPASPASSTNPSVTS